MYSMKMEKMEIRKNHSFDDLRYWAGTISNTGEGVMKFGQNTSQSSKLKDGVCSCSRKRLLKQKRGSHLPSRAK